MKKALLNVAEFTERSLRGIARGCVPIINLSERVLFPERKTTLLTVSMERFNQRPTRFSQD